MRDFRGACRQVFNRAATLQHETFELADPRAGMQLDCGRRGFAFLFVRQTEVGDAGHGGMRGDGFFKLAHLDGIAAGLDDVFHAAEEADEAEVIARGRSPERSQPSAVSRAFGSLPFAPFLLSSFLVLQCPPLGPHFRFRWRHHF